jgi:hypothetical protein
LTDMHTYQTEALSMVRAAVAHMHMVLHPSSPHSVMPRRRLFKPASSLPFAAAELPST